MTPSVSRFSQHQAQLAWLGEEYFGKTVLEE
jgi:hypothetical protein